MNFQIKLRERTGFYDPVGPAFSCAKKFSFSIEGTQIDFRAPKHKPVIKGKKPQKLMKIYRFDDYSLKFGSQNLDVVVADKWLYSNLFWHDWAFNGPWFTGCLAHVSLSIYVFKSKEPNNAISFFHPRAFEQTIGDYLTNRYSKEKNNGKYEYQAPVNWQPIDSLSVPAARLEAIADGSVGLYSKSVLLFFPIDNQHFIQMYFTPHRNVPGNSEAELDRQIGYKNLGELIDNIIGSIKVTVSPEAKTLQENAVKGLQDSNLARVFLPMDWSSQEHDASAHENLSLNDQSD